MKKAFPKILLVSTPQNDKYPQTPLGPAMIATVLEKCECKIKMLDLHSLDFSWGCFVRCGAVGNILFGVEHCVKFFKVQSLITCFW